MRSPVKFPVFILIFTFIFWFVPEHGYGQKQIVRQGNPVPPNFCIDPDELALYQMINQYRRIFELPEIPLSRSLSYVASLHVKDLFLHHNDQGPCNLHSWSDKGFWKSICYPREEDKKNSVWDKPREITRYPSKGYEIVYWENNKANIDSIMSTWRSESYFNDFLMNTGKWEGKKWNAIGIAIYENYACAWFGEVADPEGLAWVCGKPPQKKPSVDSAKLSKKTPDSTIVKSKASGATTKPTKNPKTPPVKPVPVISQGDSTSAAAHEISRTPGAVVSTGDSAVNQKSVPVDSIAYTYYIIIRTNVSQKLAEQIAREQILKGFPDAKVLVRNGKTRISTYETTDRITALAKLKEIKKTIRDAWLLKEPILKKQPE